MVDFFQVTFPEEGCYLDQGVSQLFSALLVQCLYDGNIIHGWCISFSVY